MYYQNPFFWIVLIILGLIAGYFIRQLIAAKQGNSIEQKIKNQLEEAKTQSKEIIFKAEEKATGLLKEIKKEERERNNQLNRLEERLVKKEEFTENQLSDLKLRESQISQDIEKLKTAKTQIEELSQKADLELEKIAKLSFSEARDSILKETQKKYQQEINLDIKKLEEKRKATIERRSAEIMTVAIQRYARSHISEITTTAFNLSGEDIKGKIIGREGRNIRALERITGVDLIIDETPDSLTISSFNPIRREIAKLTLEKLIKDGRIQPAKIEEKFEEAKTEIRKKITEIGEAAAYEMDIYDLPKEIIQLLGQLHFRGSYGQNVLSHSIETAYLASMLASELSLNVEIVKRGALLHDIGKAIDHEAQGSHVELGMRILKKYGIGEEIIDSMKSHHEEYPFSTPESYIVAAADALSAARPGARRDTLENYIKRLKELEKIASEFNGVKSSYAVSAGRELRIFVTPEKIDDFKALQLAKNIANKIESELKYPGEIKVNVIREIRAVEYAK